MHNGHSRASKVVDFSANQKHVCNFLLVITDQLQYLAYFKDIAHCRYG